MSSAFPLLRLPENAKRKVLNGFDAIQLINFSLLSNIAKRLARSLNITTDKIDLCPNDDFINIQTMVDNKYWVAWIFYPPVPNTFIQPARGTVPIFVPSRVKAEMNFEDIMEFENTGLSISEWLKLIIEVFNHPPVLDILWTEPVCLFDMKSLKDTVNGFSVGEHTFTEQCSIECAQQALKNMPESKTVLIEGPAFRNPVEYQDILIQNVKRLVIGSCDDLDSFDLKISLDDILLINSEWIEINSRHITDKMINRFLKHWIQGSNPRMEHMRIRFEPIRIFDEDVILKRLKYHTAQPDRMREYEEAEEIYRENAQRKVLNDFDAIHLINFSLLSNIANQLAKSLNRTIDNIHLYADDIEIYVNVDWKQSVGWTFYPPEPCTGTQPVRGIE